MSEVLSDNERGEYEDTIIMLNKVIGDLNGRIKEFESENKKLLELSENLDEHPEGYDGPCLCKLCKSYG